MRKDKEFLSTPSGWRATNLPVLYGRLPANISIHALRVEGDTGGIRNLPIDKVISIHALRVEGDLRFDHPASL